MKKEIGGYFELELSRKSSFPHSEGICLNSGRNALEYILINLPCLKRLWIPYFTCNVVLEPLEKLHIPYSFYRVNERLEVGEELNLQEGEYLLVTNYFGIKDSYLRDLAKRYNYQLIVDNAQAYFCDPIAYVPTLYSPRKFVGIPDGGIAIFENGSDANQYQIDKSFQRCSHLLKRYEVGASGGYADFKVNSHALVGQPIQRMSALTRALLSNIDFKAVKERRLTNFSYLHKALSDKNKLEIASLSDFACPMVYPYYTDDASLRQRLIANKVFVATYWPNVLDWCKPGELENELVNKILALPIDQRYKREEMNFIIKLLV